MFDFAGYARDCGGAASRSVTRENCHAAVDEALAAELPVIG